MKSVKRKLEDNDLIITQADKGKSIIIIGNKIFQNKLAEFNKDNDILIMTKYPTQKYQKEVKDVLKKCNINKSSLYKCIQMNPKALQLNALIKLHKEAQPIRQ